MNGPNGHARIQQISQLLVPRMRQPLDAHGRFLVKEGELLVWIPKLTKKKMRYIFLFNDCCLITSRQKSKYNLKAVVNLRIGGVSLEKIDSVSHNFEFRLHSQQEAFFFFADSSDNRRDWVKLMTQSIENTHPEESKSPNKKASKISQVDDFEEKPVKKPREKKQQQQQPANNTSSPNLGGNNFNNNSQTNIFAPLNNPFYTNVDPNPTPTAPLFFNQPTPVTTVQFNTSNPFATNVSPTPSNTFQPSPFQQNTTSSNPFATNMNSNPFGTTTIQPTTSSGYIHSSPNVNEFGYASNPFAPTTTVQASTNPFQTNVAGSNPFM